MTQQATENEGTAPPRLSNAKLNLAIEVAMAVKRISAAEIARQAGIPVPVMVPPGARQSHERCPVAATGLAGHAAVLFPGR